MRMRILLVVVLLAWPFECFDILDSSREKVKSREELEAAKEKKKKEAAYQADPYHGTGHLGVPGGVHTPPRGNSRVEFDEDEFDTGHVGGRRPGGAGRMPGMGGLPGGLPGGMPGGMPGGIGGGGMPGSNSMSGGNKNNDIYSQMNKSNEKPWYKGWLYESMMIMFLFSCVYSCLCGRNLNMSTMKRWYEQNKAYFKKEYEYVGYQAIQEEIAEYTENPNFIEEVKEMKEEMEEFERTFVKESEIVYKLCLAKRKNVNWLTIDFYLHDNTELMNNMLFTGGGDKVVYRFELSATEGMVFLLAQKKLRSSFSDPAQDVVID